MAQRILIGLHPHADVTKVMEAVKQLGASVRAPDASLPDVLVVTAEPPDLHAFLERAKAIAGVRYAEPDAWRTTM